MLRFFKSKAFILILITIILFIVMGVSAREDSRLNWAGNLFNSVLSPVQKLFSVSAQKIDETVSFFKDSKAIRDENKKLKARVDELEKKNNELKGLEEKNERLKEAVNLKEQLNEFELVGANIIASDAGNWFNTFTIDRGSNDGLQKDNVIVTGKGLIGRITVAGPFSSKVVSIIDVDSTVSARITKTGELVRIRGDINLKDQGLCIMDYIPPDVDISVGDSVETSGMGGIFPKGISIGKIKEVRQINSELNRYAIIKPVADFKRMEEVFALRSK